MKTFQTHIKVAILGNGSEGNFWRLWFERQQRCEIIISSEASTNESAIKVADLIIVAVPLDQISNVSEQLMLFTKEDSLVVSTCGLMSGFAKIVNATSFSVLLIHKMGRLEHTRNPTMLGINLVVCRLRIQKGWSAWVNEFLKQGSHNQAQVVTLSPENHDETMAKVQGLTRVIAILLAEFVIFDPAVNIAGSIITQMLGPIVHRICSFEPMLNAEMVTLNPAVPVIVKLVQIRLTEISQMNTVDLMKVFAELKANGDVSQLDLATKFVEALK